MQRYSFFMKTGLFSLRFQHKNNTLRQLYEVFSYGKDFYICKKNPHISIHNDNLTFARISDKTA